MTHSVIGFFVTVLFALAGTVLAAPIDQSIATKVAGNFTQGSYFQSKAGLSAPVKCALVTDAAAPQWYVYNLKPTGFIIVSGDDATSPILAYSDESNFNASNLPPQMKVVLDEYTEQIDLIRVAGLSGTPEMQAEWKSLIAGEPIFGDGEVYGPLLYKNGREIIWGQGKGWNSECPADEDGEDGHVLVGCVATAMGQVMYYYEWPTRGTGSHTYTDAIYGPQSADFGSTTYDYAAMKTNEGTNASALLLYHCGVSVDMMYGVNASGAYDQSIPSALTSYFNYHAGKYTNRSTMTDDEWTTMIAQEIMNERPVLYGAHDDNYLGGHAFVVDGYRTADSKFHLNWGWDGAENGYFLITNLNPGYFNFNSYAGCVPNVYPVAPGYLKVDLLPEAVRSEGAQWTIDDGMSWNDSGTSLALVMGDYTIKFSDVDDWDTPASQPVTIVSGKGLETTATYVLQTGSLKVTLNPQNAITSGAQWSIDGGIHWYDSGDEVTGLRVGKRTVTFKDIDGWMTPDSQTVTIKKDMQSVVSASYILANTGSLKVTLMPPSGTWSIDGGTTWYASGTKLSGLTVKTYMIQFGPVLGWVTPSEQTVTITKDQTTEVDVTYGSPGSGAAHNPYQIWNLDHLNALSAKVAEGGDVTKGMHYKLMTDIDASKSAAQNGNTGFTPIGSSAEGCRFEGTFNGNGKRICDLTTSRTADSYIGLFGYIGSNGVVTSLGIENGSFTGAGFVGPLAGRNDGSVTACYAAGSNVTGATHMIGGLVGYNGNNINTSYANVAIDGTGWYVGGLAGGNMGTINGSFAAGKVTGNKNQGGLLGQNSGTVNTSYWDTEATGQSASAGSDAGTYGKTTAEMKRAATFTGWDFANVWNNEENISYPYLRGVSMLNSLRVMIIPEEAVTGGAQWSIDGGMTWNDNGIRIDGLPTAKYTVMFKTLAAWTAGAATVDLSRGLLYTATRAYDERRPDIVLEAADFTAGTVNTGEKLKCKWTVRATETIGSPVWFEVFGSKTGGFDQIRTGGTVTYSSKQSGIDENSKDFSPSNLVINTLPDGNYTLMPSVNRATISSALAESDYTNNWLPVAGKRLRIHNNYSPTIDLTFSNSFFECDPNDETKVTVTGMILNDSGTDMVKPGCWVEVFYGTLTAEGVLMPQGTIGAGVKIETLAAGAETSVTITGTVPAGAKKRALALMVDSTDVIPELYEDNNWVLDYSPSILPKGRENGVDFTITDITVNDAQSAPNRLNPGEKLRLTLTVKNNGTVTLKDKAYIEIFASKDGGLTVMPGATLTWSELAEMPAAGEEKTYSLEKRLNNIGDGLYTLVPMVNRMGATANPGDENPMDNRAIVRGKRISLTTPETGAKYNIVWSEGPTFTRLSDGKTLAITGKIKNTGDSKTGAFWTEAFIGTVQNKTGYFYRVSGQNFAGGVYCAGLTAGEEKDISIRGTVPTGNKVVGILADSTDVVPETDETDNYDYSGLYK